MCLCCLHVLSFLVRRTLYQVPMICCMDLKELASKSLKWRYINVQLQLLNTLSCRFGALFSNLQTILCQIVVTVFSPSSSSLSNLLSVISYLKICALRFLQVVPL